MTVQRLEHIGIVVDDLAAATAFFVALGLEVEGEASVEGGSVDRINGLKGVRADVVILRTPDDSSKLELAKYRSPSYEGHDGPAPPNAPASATSCSSSTTSRHPSRTFERMAASWSASW
jgi:catechol 2,3-dioxygenase-like lactoylglutathione lyase family enzyme